MTDPLVARVASMLQKRFGRCEASYADLSEAGRKRWDEAATAIIAAIAEARQ